MLDRSRYQKAADEAKAKATSAKACEDKKKKEESAPAKQETVPAKKPVKKPKVADKGFYISGETADEFRDFLTRMAEMFNRDGADAEPGFDDESEVELEEIPEVKPAHVPKHELKSKPTSAKEESTAEKKPSPAKKPAPKSMPEPEPEGDDELELCEVFEFRDLTTGELLWLPIDEWWTVHQLVGDRYDRVWVWLEDGEFVDYATVTDLRTYLPGLFL